MHNAKNTRGAQAGGSKSDCRDPRVASSRAADDRDSGRQPGLHRVPPKPLGIVGEGLAESFSELKQAFTVKNSAGALELIRNELVAREAVIARTLAFDGVESETRVVDLSDSDCDAINTCYKIWRELLALDWDYKQRVQVFGAMLRFGKASVLATKVGSAFAFTREALDMGEQVVITLVGTGEAAGRRAASAAAAAAAAASDGLEDEGAALLWPADTLQSCSRDGKDTGGCRRRHSRSHSEED